jgi:hypothetical protein
MVGFKLKTSIQATEITEDTEREAVVHIFSVISVYSVADWGFQILNSASTFAAQMKSFSDRPWMAWVVYSTWQLLYLTVRSG